VVSDTIHLNSSLAGGAHLVAHAVADGVVQLRVVGPRRARHRSDGEVRELGQALEARVDRLRAQVVALNQRRAVAAHRQAQQPAEEREARVSRCSGEWGAVKSASGAPSACACRSGHALSAGVRGEEGPQVVRDVAVDGPGDAAPPLILQTKSAQQIRRRFLADGAGISAFRCRGRGHAPPRGRRRRAASPPAARPARERCARNTATGVSVAPRETGAEAQRGSPPALGHRAPASRGRGAPGPRGRRDGLDEQRTRGAFAANPVARLKPSSSERHARPVVMTEPRAGRTRQRLAQGGA